MESVLRERKENINEKINSIQNLINEFNKENTEIGEKVKPQVNPQLVKIEKLLNRKLDTKDKEIIRIYSKLFEKNISLFKKIFEIGTKYISLDDENILEGLKTDLNNLSKIDFNNFNHKNNNIISNQIQNSEEGQEEIIKRYKKNIIILLEDIKSFINLFIELLKKIKNLAQQLSQGLKIMSGNLPLNQEVRNITIEEIFINTYRNISKLFEKIEDIFSKIKEMEIKGKKLTLIIEKKLTGKDEIKRVNDDYSNLIKKIVGLGKNFKKEYNSIKKEEKKIRIDILVIFDVTSSMEEYLNQFRNQFKNIIDNLEKKCPTALIYIGFIGYRDKDDIELGDDYIDIGFSLNYDNLEEKINKIEADGGDDIPEDIAGAFELALKEDWNGDTKIALLITDSPCHGDKFHDLNSDEDKYKDDKNIMGLLQKFKNENISLICFKLSKNTDKMFEIFEKEQKNSQDKIKFLFFLDDKDFTDQSFIEIIGDKYNFKFEKLVEKAEKERKEKKEKVDEKDF